MTNPNDISDNRTSLACAALPPLAFALQVVMRRAAELAGYAPHLGTVLVVATASTIMLLGVTGPRGRRSRLVMCLMLFVGFASLAAASFHRLPDSGFDAQSYHLPSMLRLIEGWKPLIEPTDLTLSNDYPSAIWTVMGGFDTLFGFESGRAIGPVLMLAAGILVWTLLRQIGFAALSAAMIALIITLNPVVVSQIFTAFADGTLYLLALMLIASLLLMSNDPNPLIAVLGGAALILLINTKLSGIFFAGIALASTGSLLLACGGAWSRLALRNWRGRISSFVMAGLLAIGFVGFRPYVTNLRDHGALIYPPPNELGYQPGASSQVPPNLDGAGRVSKVAALFFARTDMRGGPVHFKWPATVEASELRMASDTRNGGFGPLFGAAATLAVASLVVTAAARRLKPNLAGPHVHIQTYVGLLIYATVTTIFFPEPWWARFVPLAWLIPLSAALLAVTLLPVCTIRIAAAVTFGLATANIAIATTCAVRDGFANAASIIDKTNRMAAEIGPVYLTRGTLWNPTINGRHAAEDVWRRRLADHGKTAVVIPRDACIRREFLTVDVWRCQPLAGEHR